MSELASISSSLASAASPSPVTHPSSMSQKLSRNVTNTALPLKRKKKRDARLWKEGRLSYFERETHAHIHTHTHDAGFSFCVSKASGVFLLELGFAAALLVILLFLAADGAGALACFHTRFGAGESLATGVSLSPRRVFASSGNVITLLQATPLRFPEWASKKMGLSCGARLFQMSHVRKELSNKIGRCLATARFRDGAINLSSKERTPTHRSKGHKDFCQI